MVVNDNAGNLIPRAVFEFIASLLAPTGVCCSQFPDYCSKTFADKSPYNPFFVSYLSKDSACKPPTRVAGIFWA